MNATENGKLLSAAGERNVKTLELCENAIAHVLSRIQDDKDVRFYLGAGTEAFGKLTAAYAALTLRPVNFVRNKIIPGSAAMYRENHQ